MRMCYNCAANTDSSSVSNSDAVGSKGRKMGG